MESLLNYLALEIKTKMVDLLPWRQQTYMQSLVFLTYFLKKLLKNLWGSPPPPPPPLGKGRVNKTVNGKFCLLLDDSRLAKSDMFYLSITCF